MARLFAALHAPVHPRLPVRRSTAAITLVFAILASLEGYHNSSETCVKSGSTMCVTVPFSTVVPPSTDPSSTKTSSSPTTSGG